MTASANLPEITAAELKARLDAGDVPVLVDVREAYEASIADLPDHGQVRIPTGELMSRMKELDPGREHVVYCRSGSRSAWATLVLRQSGFDKVLNLKGGVLAWREDVDPSLEAY